MTDKSRKKVLYYSPTIWGNTDFYRTTGVLPFINHPELILRDISHFGQINQWDLSGSDVIVIQRPCTPDNLQLIKLAKSCGLKVVIDYDDNVIEVDMFNPTFIQYQQQRNIILQCIKLADEVWCSTQGVKNAFGKGIVIQNAFNGELLNGFSDFNSESNKVVWRGGSSHEGDIYENPESLVDLVNNHTNFEFYFIGHRFTYLEMRCGDNFNSVEAMPIMQYFAYLKQLKPKAIIFPLRETALNIAKSNISWMETTYAGAAFFGNTMLPEFNVSGTLPLTGFRDLIKNNEVLASSWNISRGTIEENLTLEKVNQLRIESLLNL